MRGDILGEEQLVAVQAVSVINDFLAQLHLSGRGYVIKVMLLLLLRCLGQHRILVDGRSRVGN